MSSTTKGEWHDWVGELFEPAFGATIDDLVAHEEEAKNKPRVKHISVYDPEAVRKVHNKITTVLSNNDCSWMIFCWIIFLFKFCFYIKNTSE